MNDECISMIGCALVRTNESKNLLLKFNDASQGYETHGVIQFPNPWRDSVPKRYR
jgi:hypothetical protein